MGFRYVRDCWRDYSVEVGKGKQESKYMQFIFYIRKPWAVLVNKEYLYTESILIKQTEGQLPWDIPWGTWFQYSLDCRVPVILYCYWSFYDISTRVKIIWTGNLKNCPSCLNWCANGTFQGQQRLRAWQRKVFVWFCSQVLLSLAANLIYPVVAANPSAVPASSEAGTVGPAPPWGASLPGVKSAVRKSYLGVVQPLRPRNLSTSPAYQLCSFWRPQLTHQAPQLAQASGGGTVLFSCLVLIKPVPSAPLN